MQDCQNFLACPPGLGVSEAVGRGAGRYVLDSLIVTPHADLAQLHTPTLLIVGDHDPRRTTTANLANLLPNGTLVEVPGDHITALAATGLADAIASFTQP